MGLVLEFAILPTYPYNDLVASHTPKPWMYGVSGCIKAAPTAPQCYCRSSQARGRSYCKDTK
jgi:hypothetical protein